MLLRQITRIAHNFTMALLPFNTKLVFVTRFFSVPSPTLKQPHVTDVAIDLYTMST